MDGRVQARAPGDPRRLGPYELLGRLGQGGMGVVFLGRERRGGRLAAVKAIRPELAGDPAFAARFRREVEAARRVDSPQVARVLDADPAAARPWLATEYVDGATLADAVAATGPLTGGRLAAFAAGVAQALTAIHAAGVVHRDLKATNVLLPRSPGPEVKVIDFGIARAADATMTRSGLRFGTPSWMAPEQLRDRPAGPPADVFAWGLLVAFAASGRHPFGGGPADAVAYRILHDRPDLDGVREPLRSLVRDALARDPAARPTAAGLATTLTAAVATTVPLLAAGSTVPLPVAGPAGPLPVAGPTLPLPATGPTRRPRRRRVGRLLAAAALLAGLASTPHMVLAAVAGPDDPATRQEAEHCRCGHERAEARHADDKDEDEGDEETETEDAGPDREDAPEERDAEKSPGGGCDGKVSPGAGQPHQSSAPPPPPSTQPPPPPTRPSAPPAPAGPVLGS
jgi:eukaryotic-like serine/threonine-protein kinase